MRLMHYGDIHTSSLGYGCVSLTMHDTTQQAVNVLETAYEYGISHFDVARSYGSGRCEHILGKFIKGRRDQITIATKFGLESSIAIPKFGQHMIDVIKPVMNFFPGLKSGARAVLTKKNNTSNFSAKDAEYSLNASLKALGTDYIDILLYHECTLKDANNEEFLEFLMKAKLEGKIRCFGVASMPEKLVSNNITLDNNYSIIQTENQLLTNVDCSESRLHIGHSIFKNLNAIQKTIATSNNLSGEIPERFNKLGNQELAELLLRRAKLQNKNGIVLFSSKKIRNIMSNIKIWNDRNDDLDMIQQFDMLLKRWKV